VRLGHREHDRAQEDQADKVRRGHHAGEGRGSGHPPRNHVPYTE
jgi:hypothetical protein